MAMKELAKEYPSEERYKTIPVIHLDMLSDEQRRAYALAHNRTAELSKWDPDILGKEIGKIFQLDMSQFGFTEGDAEEMGGELDDDKYTTKVKIPQYEITGECPELSDMLDSSKADELIEEIKSAENVPEDVKEFLIQAARRHNVFNYRNIAEYYAHADADVQRLFEKSALVIIDVDDAIANGYATLMADVLDMMGNEE